MARKRRRVAREEGGLFNLFAKYLAAEIRRRGSIGWRNRISL